MLHEQISHDTGLEIIPKRISPIDNIIIVNDFLSSRKISKIISKHTFTYPEEKYVKEIVTNDMFTVYLLLSCNHLHNFLLDIYFTIGNPYLFGKDTFNVIYEKRESLKLIPDIISKMWRLILETNMKKYYNKTMIQKWLETCNFKVVTRERAIEVIGEANSDIYVRYQEIWKIFESISLSVKDIIKNLLIEYSAIDNVPGCSNLPHGFYEYFVSINTGLTNVDRKFLTKLVKWSKKELSRLIVESDKLISELLPSISQLKYIDKIKYLSDTQDQKFKTVEEFKDTHIEIIKKLEKYYIEQHGFPNLEKLSILPFDDKNLGAAYWSNDTFYLNTANWDKVNRYEVLPLCLHEGIPGHHTQISYYNHSNDNNQIEALFSWFGYFTSGYFEGWALWSEQLSPNNIADHAQMKWYRLGQLQFETLRTLRVIADISLHGVGINTNTLIDFMSNFLAMSRNKIEAEVFRYASIPGQALCYKLGSEIFKTITYKVVGDNIMSEDAFKLYKKILVSKPKPLSILMKEFGINNDDLFV